MLETLNGYTLEAPFQNENAGMSQWTIAEKNGVRFFLKRFLSPIYPDEDTLSNHMREIRIAECNQYVEAKKKLYKAVDEAGDGNIVRILEFFRCDSYFYIVTPLIGEEKLSIEKVSQTPMDDRLLLCLTVSHSVMKLHQMGVIHADIKDTNVLLKRTQKQKLTGKLIDFDCSFFSYAPPKTEGELGGDQVYLSPEACMFICGEETRLTEKMDVFALGLLFHQYLTGKLPEYDHDKNDYAHEAVLDGDKIVISDELPEDIQDLLSRMLLYRPEERPSSEEVYYCLKAQLVSETSKQAEQKDWHRMGFYIPSDI